MINNFAWIGTGECNPNKGFIEALVVTGCIVGWVGIIIIIKKLSQSSMSNVFRYGFTIILVIGGIIGTLFAWGITWLSLACSR